MGGRGHRLARNRGKAFQAQDTVATDDVGDLFGKRLGVCDFTARDDEAFEFVVAVFMFVIVVVIVFVIVVVMMVMHLVPGLHVRFGSGFQAEKHFGWQSTHGRLNNEDPGADRVRQRRRGRGQGGACL